MIIYNIQNDLRDRIYEILKYTILVKKIKYFNS